MTSRERVLTAFRRQQPDRVPAVLYGEMVGYVPLIEALLAEKCSGLSPRDYFKFDITSFSLQRTRLTTDFSSYSDYNEQTTVDEWGVGWKRGRFLHYAEIVHPLQNAADEQIAAYPFPDLDQAYRYEAAGEEIAAIHRDGLAAGYFAGSVFETAWYMRSMDQLLMDLMSEQEGAVVLLDRITDIVAASASYLAEADLDLLILGDDIAMQTGMMMSLDFWRHHFKPRLAKIINAAKAVKPDILVFYHSDGNVWDAVPDLIDAGVEVLNPVQPECMNPAEVKAAFGDSLSFFGTVSVQETMPRGTPADVKTEVRKRMETIGKGGGLLLAPSHVLQPDTPWENIVAFFEAVEEYGYY